MAYANVPQAPEGKVMAINPQMVQEAAHERAEIMKERRAESQIQRNARTKRADAVMGDAVESASWAMDATMLNHLSEEQKSMRIIDRMANVVLLAGRAFTPVTLREATDAANAWAGIAYKLAQIRKLANMPDDEDADDPVKRAAATMKQLERHMRQRNQAS